MNLNIVKDNSLIIIGPSGADKSVLVKTIIGLLPPR
ncbi:hypothetical protein [Candidatus Megaera venefica]|nr:hypothetical protein [Candidatus Megaera venefica]